LIPTKRGRRREAKIVTEEGKKKRTEPLELNRWARRGREKFEL